jgi:hypothetical protein
MKFLDSDIYKLVLTSAVIAALITSVFNYLGARETNIRLVEIEELKRNSDLEVYRYTNIFESLKELNTLPDIDYTYLSLDENGNYVQDLR